MTPIIKVENLSKQYRIGSRQASYATLRDSLTDAVSAPFRRLKSLANGNGKNPQSVSGNPQSNLIWALKDVTFEVMPGEVVGIIGRNGAGKTTLLKILSRITEPTKGGIDLHGRVGSLLEVGTGFHPELTGRENIYLNGAILGMKRAEIERKFDEIVAFAEIERFLDTPVKHFSSGMYIRLAFAVAAHLDPEVLVVDEVLAVGDVNFQKKCLGKMEEVGRQGRTVLFVSHSMPMILRLCSRAILLDMGNVTDDGPAQQVTRSYLHSAAGSPVERTWQSPRTAPGDSVARLHSVRVLNDQHQTAETFDIRRPVMVEVKYWNLQGTERLSANLHFFNEDGICIFITADFNNRQWWDEPRVSGLVRATCIIPGNLLAEGRLFVLAAVSSYNPTVVHVSERDAVSFQVIDRSEGDGVRGHFVAEWPGAVRPMLDWEVSVEQMAVLLDVID
jgi:lipopolysaccharide transport system ATP-binding protein